jgi:hypothetical protein
LFFDLESKSFAAGRIVFSKNLSDIDDYFDCKIRYGGVSLNVVEDPISTDTFEMLFKHFFILTTVSRSKRMTVWT